MLMSTATMNIIQNIRGKIAIVADECNLPYLFFTIKNIKDSEINLYLEVNGSSYIINDIKDYCDSFINTDSSAYKGSITEIFSPFDYNAVVCFGSKSLVDKIVDTCNAYATPVKVLESNFVKSSNSAKTA
jgi:dihydroorotate dehydrogenase electron transfer subunit